MIETVVSWQSMLQREESCKNPINFLLNFSMFSTIIGVSYQDAQKQYVTELWKEAAETYAVSAISGGMSATGASILGSVRNRIRNTKTANDKKGRDD